jgi:hypothetical protein
MEPIQDASQHYEVERRARHAERPGFRISELQISPTQQVPWHYHSHIQDTFYVIEGQLRLFSDSASEPCVRVSNSHGSSITWWLSSTLLQRSVSLAVPPCRRSRTPPCGA